MNQCSQQNSAKSAPGTEVFVGGLAATVTEKKIREIFSTCGEIVEIRLIKDFKGALKGYCFVRFATKEAADKAVKEKSECLVDGKKIGVLPSMEQDTLFLGSLHKGWNAEEFEKFVRQVFPDVVSVNLVMLGDVQPSQKLQNRGFGFVKFSSHAAAARAYRVGSVADFILAGNVHPSIKWAEEEQEHDPEEIAKIKIAFVRDLPATIDESHMRKLFEPYGKVDKVVLSRKGNSQLGFIYFDQRQDLDNAIKEMNGKAVQGPQGGQPYKLQVEVARPMEKKRKRAPEDSVSKLPTIVQSQPTLFQNYLRVHSTGVPATSIQKEVQHADSYEKAVIALPLAVKERLLRILRLGIASHFDIDEDCLVRLKELPESNAISVLDQFMLSGAEMQDKGAYLAGLISKNLLNRARLGQSPLSLSREATTLSREPVISSLSRRTHLPEVDYMVNNASLASHFDSTNSRSDIYPSRYSELHSDYLSSHSMLGRMSDGFSSDSTTIASIGNSRGRLHSGVISLTDHILSPLDSTTSSYTSNPRIGLGLHSPREAFDRNLSSLSSIASSGIDNVRMGLNSHINGPMYESLSPTHMMQRPNAYGRFGMTYTAAAPDRRIMESVPTSSISYNRVPLDEPTTANGQPPRQRARFDPFTGEPYKFDPFTGEPIVPESASRHN